MNPGSALSTQGWTNGPDQMTCNNYARLWCENGDARPGQEWALDRPQYRQPRLNCCACGKQGCDVVPTLTPTLTHQVDKSRWHSEPALCSAGSHHFVTGSTRTGRGAHVSDPTVQNPRFTQSAQARTHAFTKFTHSHSLTHTLLHSHVHLRDEVCQG
jgi:hypothetical protein